MRHQCSINYFHTFIERDSEETIGNWKGGSAETKKHRSQRNSISVLGTNTSEILPQQQFQLIQMKFSQSSCQSDKTQSILPILVMSNLYRFRISILTPQVFFSGRAMDLWLKVQILQGFES